MVQIPGVERLWILVMPAACCSINNGQNHGIFFGAIPDTHQFQCALQESFHTVLSFYNFTGISQRLKDTFDFLSGRLPLLVTHFCW